MDKDWNARFEPEKPRLSRWYLTIIAVPLLVACVLWAILVIGTGFQDSMGTPRNSDLRGHIYVFTYALAPVIVPAFLIYWDWRRHSKNSN